jgi:hypothetical protein
MNSGLNTPFTCNQYVKMEFYGPITNVTLNSPLPIKISQEASSENFAGFMNLERTGPGNRTLQFRAKEPYRLPINNFVVTRNPLASTTLIRCDVPLQPPTAEFNDNDSTPGYDYDVLLDCALMVGGPFDCIPNTPSECEVPIVLCNDIDFNNDDLFPSDDDTTDFLNVLAGGPCSTGTCDPIDFNNDGLFPDDLDLISYLSILAGGSCFQ